MKITDAPIRDILKLRNEIKNRLYDELNENREVLGTDCVNSEGRPKTGHHDLCQVFFITTASTVSATSSQASAHSSSFV